MHSQVLRGACVSVVLVLAAFAAAGDPLGISDAGPPFSPASKDDPSARKPSQGPPAVLYSLGEGSAYVEGCFGGGEGGEPACLCPLSLASTFEGPFSLTPAPSDDPNFEVFIVEGVAWTVGMGDESFTITGSGEYRIGTAKGQTVQEMVLDLSFDAGPEVAFHSGLVPVPDEIEFPAIAVAVNMNDYQCYDTEITIQSEPGE